MWLENKSSSADVVLNMKPKSTYPQPKSTFKSNKFKETPLKVSLIFKTRLYTYT